MIERTGEGGTVLNGKNVICCCRNEYIYTDQILHFMSSKILGFDTEFFGNNI